jgi:hypothetical protein
MTAFDADGATLRCMLQCFRVMGGFRKSGSPNENSRERSRSGRIPVAQLPKELFRGPFDNKDLPKAGAYGITLSLSS